DEKMDLTQIKSECEPSKTEGKDTRKDDDNEEEEGGASKADADEGSSTSRLGGDNMTMELEDGQESQDNSGRQTGSGVERGEDMQYRSLGSGLEPGMAALRIWATRRAPCVVF
ncbi:hypothetical protein XENOCAPTIV_019150, partial [Xenoophorus captivus]